MTSSVPRYALICVAPDVASGGLYADLDEAIVAADAYHDVYDRLTDTYVTPDSWGEVEAARERFAAKRGLSS